MDGSIEKHRTRRPACGALRSHEILALSVTSVLVSRPLALRRPDSGDTSRRSPSTTPRCDDWWCHHGNADTAPVVVGALRIRPRPPRDPETEFDLTLTLYNATVPDVPTTSSSRSAVHDLRHGAARRDQRPHGARHQQREVPRPAQGRDKRTVTFHLVGAPGASPRTLTVP